MAQPRSKFALFLLSCSCVLAVTFAHPADLTGYEQGVEGRPLTQPDLSPSIHLPEGNRGLGVHSIDSGPYLRTYLINLPIMKTQFSVPSDASLSVSFNVDGDLGSGISINVNERATRPFVGGHGVPPAGGFGASVTRHAQCTDPCYVKRNGECVEKLGCKQN